MSKVVWEYDEGQSYRYTLQRLEGNGSWMDEEYGEDLAVLKIGAINDSRFTGSKYRIIDNHPEEPVPLVE